MRWQQDWDEESHEFNLEIKEFLKAGAAAVRTASQLWHCWQFVLDNYFIQKCVLCMIKYLAMLLVCTYYMQ